MEASVTDIDPELLGTWENSENNFSLNPTNFYLLQTKKKTKCFATGVWTYNKRNKRLQMDVKLQKGDWQFPNSFDGTLSKDSKKLTISVTYYTLSRTSNIPTLLNDYLREVSDKNLAQTALIAKASASNNTKSVVIENKAQLRKSLSKQAASKIFQDASFSGIIAAKSHSRVSSIHREPIKLSVNYTPEGRLIPTGLSNLQICKEMRKFIQMKDLVDRGEKFEGVFTGSDLIDEMMKHLEVKDRQETLDLAKAFIDGLCTTRFFCSIPIFFFS